MQEIIYYFKPTHVFKIESVSKTLINYFLILTIALTSGDFVGFNLGDFFKSGSLLNLYIDLKYSVK